MLYPSGIANTKYLNDLAPTLQANVTQRANDFMNAILAKEGPTLADMAKKLQDASNLDKTQMETFSRDVLSRVSQEFRPSQEWQNDLNQVRTTLDGATQAIVDKFKKPVVSPQTAAITAWKESIKSLPDPIISAAVGPTTLAMKVLLGGMFTDKAFKAATKRTPEIEKELKTGASVATTALTQGYHDVTNKVSSWFENDVLGPEAAKRTASFMDALHLDKLTITPETKTTAISTMTPASKPPQGFVKWPRSVIQFTGSVKDANRLTAFILLRLKDPMYIGMIKAALRNADIPITPYSVALLASLGIKEGGTRVARNSNSTATGYFQLLNDTAYDAQLTLADASSMYKRRLADSIAPYNVEKARLALKGYAVDPDSVIRKRQGGESYQSATWVTAVAHDPTNQVIPTVIYLTSLLKKTLQMATFADGRWYYKGQRQDIADILYQPWARSDYYAGLSVLLAIFHTNGIYIDKAPGKTLAHVKVGDANSRVYMVNPFTSISGCDYQIMCYILASPTCYSYL